MTFGFCRAGALLATLCCAAATAGCAITDKAMRVGDGYEYFVSYEEVRLAGEEVQVGIGTLNSSDPHPDPWAEKLRTRWIAVPLASLSWAEAEKLADLRRYPLPYDCTPDRAAVLPDATQSLPVHKSAPTTDDPLAAALQAHTGAISAHAFDRDTVLLLLQDDPAGGAVLASALNLYPRMCTYTQPWALPVRAILLPFSVAADIVTAPFAFLFGMLIW